MATARDVHISPMCKPEPSVDKWINLAKSDEKLIRFSKAGDETFKVADPHLKGQVEAPVIHLGTSPMEPGN